MRVTTVSRAPEPGRATPAPGPRPPAPAPVSATCLARGVSPQRPELGDGPVFRGCCSTCHLRLPRPPGRGRALRRRRECHCTNARSLVPSAPDTSCLGRKGAGSRIRLGLRGLLGNRLPRPPRCEPPASACSPPTARGSKPVCGESQQGTTGSSGTERGRRATLPLGVASTVSLWEAGHQAPILCRMGACPDQTPCDNAAFGTSSPKDHVVTLTPVGGLPCAPGPRLKAPHRTHPAPRGRTRSALQMKRPRLRSQTGIRKRRRVDRGPRTADALPGALRRTRGGRAPRLW